MGMDRHLPNAIVTHTGPVFRVESVLVPDADGTPRRKDVVRHPGAVTVIPELEDGRIVMIRNRRVAVGRVLLEFCAGKLERGEEPALAASRELEEECGFHADAVLPLGTLYTSPGFCDELMHVFLATGLHAVPQRLEPAEEIAVEPVAPTAIAERIASGELVDGKSIAAWALWRLHRARTVP